LLSGLPGSGGLPDWEWRRVQWLWREEQRLAREEGRLQKRMQGLDARLRRQAQASGREYELDRLVKLRGIGLDSARRICWYVADFSRFGSGRSFAAYCGLTSAHVRSGDMDVDLGISKAGNGMLRWTLVQLANSFFMWQPDCAMVRKWSARRGAGGTCRRVAKVALARELAVALWHWVVQDQWPAGAIESK
jgi:transposase